MRLYPINCVNLQSQMQFLREKLMQYLPEGYGAPEGE